MEERDEIRKTGQTRTETLGYLKIGAAAAIWGSIGLFVRALDMPVLVMVFYRFLFALITIFFILLIARKSPAVRGRKNLFLLICSGVFLTLNWVFFFYALVLTTIANAVLVTYTAPILVAFFAPIFIKERLEPNTLVSLFLSMGGILLIVSPTKLAFGKPLMGIIFALGTSITYATLVILAKQLLPRVSIPSMLFYQSLIATIALSPFALKGDVGKNSTAWVILVIMGVFHTVLAPYLYLNGLKVVKAQRAGVFTYFDPLSAAFLAAIFLGEIPTITTLVGGLLIIAAGYNLIRKSE